MGHGLAVTFRFTTSERPSVEQKDLCVCVNWLMDAFDSVRSFLFSSGLEIQSGFFKNKLHSAIAPRVYFEFYRVSLTTQNAQLQKQRRCRQS